MMMKTQHSTSKVGTGVPPVRGFFREESLPSAAAGDVHLNVECCELEVERCGAKHRSGFTLLEILVAVVLLATAFTIIWSTFSAALNGWRRSSEFLDRITHGDFVIDQLESSLRSAVFFSNRPDKYGFWLESQGGGENAKDNISWVTSGSAFMLPGDPLANGVHRIMVTVEDAPGGDSGLSVRAFQHMKKEIDEGDVEPWFISSRVIGLDCEVYNFEDEDWDTEWEDTNAVPSLLQVTVFLEPLDDGEPAVKVQRIVEIPVAPAVTSAVSVAGTDGTESGQGDESMQGDQNQNQTDGPVQGEVIERGGR